MAFLIRVRYRIVVARLFNGVFLGGGIFGGISRSGSLRSGVLLGLPRIVRVWRLFRHLHSSNRMRDSPLILLILKLLTLWGKTLTRLLRKDAVACAILSRIFSCILSLCSTTSWTLPRAKRPLFFVKNCQRELTRGTQLSPHGGYNPDRGGRAHNRGRRLARPNRTANC